MAMLYKSFYLCDTSVKQVNLDLNPFGLDWWVDTTSKPVWVTEYQNSVSGSSVAYGLNPVGIGAGTYHIEFSAFQDDASGASLGEFYIEIVIASTCDSEQEVCCSDEAVTLRWLNREGGISQWTFAGVRKFEMRLGDANTFKNIALEKFYSQRKDVYRGKSVSTKQITLEQVDFLDSLRYAIQAWQWDGKTATPILLDNDSYLKFPSNAKIYEVSIKYVYAQEIKVQTQ